MKITQTWEKHKPDTINGSSITMKFTYQGSDEEIKEVEDWCKQNISTATIFEEVQTDDDTIRCD